MMGLTSGGVVVVKFGGTSVSTRERWETIAQVARGVLAEGLRPVVVCSALSGVSNLLERVLGEAVRGEHRATLDEIIAKHVKLGESMGVDARALLAEELGLIERLALGTSLTREVSPRLQAAVMATGELMSTRMGAAFMSALGLDTSWLDARELLSATREVSTNEQRHYLSAACGFAPDEALMARLGGIEASVLLTQGFIARDEAGETVLLGRGGSDTSAAYIAAKLGAARLEIWTDVPGMFTANPRQVPSARLLRQLDYQEAQELATMGAKVLHPRCIEPARRYGIPLHIRCTTHPEMEGTVISAQAPKSGPQVKAVSTKGKIPLVVLDTVGMWQQVGFLSDVFGTFKQAGLSIDLIATSETNVTLTLDPVANALDTGTLQALVRDLGQYCQARTVGPCASVSLVGHNIRAILHQLGPALEVFEEQQIYLMSQAASDLNLTFVVDEDQADRLVRELHALLFGGHAADALIGPTWAELFEQPGGDPDAHAMPVWWSERAAELCALAAGGPTYVYDVATLNGALDQLQALKPIDQLFYAIKANPNADILRLFEARGMSFECVSPGELDHVRGLFPSLPVARMLFTPNFAPIEEYAYALGMGVTVTLDNLHPIKAHPEVFRGARLFARLDPGVGRGHHKHVRTAGPESKFGLSVGELPELLALAASVGAKIVGLHAHVGSGIRDAETWAENAMFLAGLAQSCPDVATLNLGGGLGVVERPGDAALQLAEVASSLATFKEAHPRLKLWLEPGRFCVAGAGALVTRVTQLKDKGERAYVGVDTGMNSLIRPSLYGAYHEIVNLTRLGEPMELTADVVGPICETGDVLGYGRRLPRTEEGDVLLIGTASAYGHAMASRYNLREPAREAMLGDARGT
jgi:bifunctional diaminopimelate decarboxylase / aspartate kinase